MTSAAGEAKKSTVQGNFAGGRQLGLRHNFAHTVEVFRVWVMVALPMGGPSCVRSDLQEFRPNSSRFR